MGRHRHVPGRREHGSMPRACPVILLSPSVCPLFPPTALSALRPCLSPVCPSLKVHPVSCLLSPLVCLRHRGRRNGSRLELQRDCLSQQQAGRHGGGRVGRTRDRGEGWGRRQPGETASANAQRGNATPNAKSACVVAACSVVRHKVPRARAAAAACASGSAVVRSVFMRR